MYQKGTQILVQESLAKKNGTQLATAIEGRKMVLSICRPCSTWRSMGRCTVLYPPRCKPWSSSGLVGGFSAPTLVDHMDSSEATTAWLSEMHCRHQHCGGVRGVKVIMVGLHLLFGCILWTSRSSQNLGVPPFTSTIWQDIPNQDFCLAKFHWNSWCFVLFLQASLTIDGIFFVVDPGMSKVWAFEKTRVKTGWKLKLLWRIGNAVIV